MPTSDIAALLAQRQATRLMQIHFPNEDGPDSAFLINGLHASEVLSKDFVFTLEVINDDAYIQAKRILGKLVTVELERSTGEPRYFNGYVSSFKSLRTDGGYAFYEMVLLPWLAFLKKRQDQYIFHNQTLKATVAEIFADYPEANYSLQLTQSYPVETFRVQYEESDHNYIHRRIEERGWVYWYEHSRDGHRLIISDDTTLAAPIDGVEQIRFHTDSTVEESDSITHWSPQRDIASGKVSLRTFDFKDPKPQEAQTQTRNEQGTVTDYEVYEYPGAYAFKDYNAGRKLADLRMEEIEALAKTFNGEGNGRSLQPGRSFELTEHFDHDRDSVLERQFLVTGVEHFAYNNYLQGNASPVYRNSFDSLRKRIPWRPGRHYHSDPVRMHGLQTAIVTCPEGQEIYCDEHGRVRVQFHWDRLGKNNDNSSCPVRVASQWAGSNFGVMSLPRRDQEVIVAWLNGDPDQPIIIGRAYNAANMPPWELPANKTQSGILTRSSQGGSSANANALRFEDKKDQEQLWLHAEKDQLTEVENDEDKWVGNDRRKTIDRDETVLVKRDRTETVDNNETITVHNDRSERVDHNETISVGDNRTEDVGQNETISIGSNRSVTVGGSKTETVAKTKAETIGLAKALSIGGAYQTTVGAAMNTSVGLMQGEQVGLSKIVSVGNKYSISAGDEFEITVGKSSLIMKSDGTILINGTKFDFHATGSVKLSCDGPSKITGKDVNMN